MSRSPFSTLSAQGHGTDEAQAPAGLDAAQYRLGLMYAKGRGVEQDHAEAVKWYREAADKGHAFPQFRIGVM